MKKILITIITIVLCTVTVFAAAKSFTITSTNLSFNNSKQKAITKEFNKKYDLSYKISSKDEELKQEITSLAKKVTYLLLGEMNEDEETPEEYYNRHKEYLKLRYAPKIPKDENSFTGYDEKSQEYKDDLVSGAVVPNLFLTINELKIKYNTFGDIRVVETDGGMLAISNIPNIKLKVASTDNPKEYELQETNLSLLYYFKKNGTDYQLYYLSGETYNDEADEITSNSNLNLAYDYSKLNSLTQTDIDNVTNIGKENVMYLTSNYNNYVVGHANAIVINKGLLVTTWSFIEEALINAQYITIIDSNNNTHQLDGIVTANINSDLAVLKLKAETPTNIKIANSDKVTSSDPSILVSYQPGKTTTRKGIVTANDGYIQTSIPITLEEVGSPILDKDGNLIGMTKKEMLNTSTSVSIPSNALKEVQDLFNNIEFNKIKTVSFDKLKENYYYVKYEEEIEKTSIPEKVWDRYKEIGNIDKTINIDLVKSSYKNKVLSLRYKNNAKEYIPTMQLVSSFTNKLKEQGYKKVSESNTKVIYKNNKYQVTIMEEFDYLIIVMVKL